MLTDRHVLAALAAGFVAGMPALFMIYKFGAANADSVAGRPGDLPRNTAGAWLFYAEQMPSQLGYATVTLAIAALILAANNRLRLERWSLILLGVWFVIGYILFSLISIREPRHDLMILFPVILLAGMAPVTISKCRPWGSAAVLLLGLGTYSYSVVLYPPPVVAGYRDVALHAPSGSVVVFSGYRDGNFVFDMREHAERRDLTSLRADKLLSHLQNSGMCIV